jgi:class 3 adenylate cyclase
VVAKSTADGVMALFGSVVAHEDDAERAFAEQIGITFYEHQAARFLDP